MLEEKQNSTATEEEKRIIEEERLKTEKENLLKQFKSSKFEKHISIFEINRNLFPILHVNNFELWPKAEDVRVKFSISFGSRKMNFTGHGISYKDWNDIIKAFPMPDLSDENLTDDEREELFSRNQLSRKVRLFELGLNKEIPGETQNDKERYLVKMGLSENERMYQAISKSCLCFQNETEQLIVYNRMKENLNPLSFNDFNDIFKINEENPYCIAFEHPGDKFIIEVPLKSITEEDRFKIEKEYVIPPPPKRPARSTTGKLDFSKSVSYENEPAYLASVDKIRSNKMIAYICAALPFEVPGEDIIEKKKSIYSLTAGDCINLSRFIDDQFLNAGDTADFF